MEACLQALVYTILFSVSVSLATVVLHEAGHYLSGLLVGCSNIKLVLIDSETGTYTQMNCVNKQPAYFALAGAFMLTLPFALSFLLLKGFERNFLFVTLGFNLTISMVDIPILFLQPIALFLGIASIVFGECLLVDKSLFSIEARL
jgi:hypothetical protein